MLINGKIRKSRLNTIHSPVRSPSGVFGIGGCCLAVSGTGDGDACFTLSEAGAPQCGHAIAFVES